MNEDLIQACYFVWRSGFKREKGLQYCSDVLGYKPLEEDYVEAFRIMFNRYLG